jgi:hypothetical protein
VARFVQAAEVQFCPSVDVAYTGKLVSCPHPTATKRPEEFTVTDTIRAAIPFITAGVVQLDPLLDVAYTGISLVVYLNPTATKRPAEFTVTEYIFAKASLLFIRAGVVHVDPLLDVA